MSLTSSEIQKKLERGAFSIHIAHKQIEALKAEIAGHEEQMYDIARSLYDDANLVEAAIAMAQMSIPALEMRASKIVAENSQPSPSSVSREDALAHFVEGAIDSVASPSPVGDHLSAVGEVSPELTTDGAGLAKIYAEEFFGVEVPVSQFDFAREIKHEAAVSVRQNTKNNTYASDRGKNAWRKALFTRARADYAKNGVPTDEPDALPPAEEPETTDIVSERDTVFTADTVHSADDVQVIDQSPEMDVVEADVGVEEVPDQVSTTDAVPDVSDESDDYLIEDVIGAVDDGGNRANDNSGSTPSEFVDVSVFDEPSVTDDSDDPADAVSDDVSSTTDDDHTLSIADTFFPDDDVPVLEPITFDDEASHYSDHDETDSTAEPEDIDVPDFDPDAELFDEKSPEASVTDTASAPVDEPVVAEPVSQETRAEVATQQSTPEHSRRAVSISSIPVHQRPGAPRPHTVAPARPQPAGTAGRVVTVPGPRSTPSAAQQPVTSSAIPAVKPSPAPAPSQVASPSTPSKSVPPRTAPARTVDAPTRTHGYGAKVPAPPGIDEAIRERDAAAAKVSTTPAAPARPGSAPVRPGPSAPRPPLFTKPTFNR